MVPATLEQLTDASERVVVGTVTDLADEAGNPARPPAIVATVSVSETWKGSPVREVTVRQLAIAGPGGKLRPFPGLPRFQEGERVVLFLPRPSRIGFSPPVGLGQGVFRFRTPWARPEHAEVYNELRNGPLFREVRSTPLRAAMAKAGLRIDAARGKVRLTQTQLRDLVHAQGGAK
jgi:hypothetical protein